MAMGLDDIPMRLITSQGSKIKQKLREAANRITTQGTMHEQWRLSRMSLISRERAISDNITSRLGVGGDDGRTMTI